LNIGGEALELDFASGTKADNVSEVGNPECRQVSEVKHLPTPQPTLTQKTADPLPTPPDTKFCEEDPYLSRCSPNKRESEDKFLCFTQSPSNDEG
jgi:hypothetical protein